MRFKNLFLVLSIIISFNGCKLSDTDTLNLRMASDPDGLNIVNAHSENAFQVCGLIFNTMTGVENKCDCDMLPVLIDKLPIITPITDGPFTGGMKLDYHIREEAKWDNGTPVTGHDYTFTIKTILNPETNCQFLKSFYDWVGDIVVDPKNPKHFTVYSNQQYFKVEEFSAMYLIPAYNYDPENLMAKFTIQDMNTGEKRDALKTNSDIKKFAEEFNSEKYARDPKYISGCGAYELVNWTTGQEIVLKKKKNWWGDALAENKQFWAHPKKIRFRIINDANTAISALKDGQLDVYYGTPPKDFQEFEKDQNFKSKFKLYRKDVLAFSMLLMNLRNDKFKDIRVRKALAHSVDRVKINEIVNFGENDLTESFIHPTQKIYNKYLEPYKYDVKLANQLLDEAGWIDTDGDGIRDKTFNGEKVQLKIQFLYSSNNEQRKNTGLIIQEDFIKIGVALEMISKEFAVYIQEMDKLNFEMSHVTFSINPRGSDPKQIWHTVNAIPGGDNKSGWGTPETDALIDQLIGEIDYDKRKIHYLDLQRMIHDDVPAIFLFSPKNRMAISKKYEVETHFLSPGFNINEFRKAN